MKYIKKLNVGEAIPGSQMKPYSWAILVEVPPFWNLKVGALVYRGDTEISFPEVKNYVSPSNYNCFQVRPLMKGESILIEGPSE
jgi:hypothetical protein